MTTLIRVREAITLEQIRAAKPKKIYYAVHTCWWTHDPAHLSLTADEHRLPCDPRGSVLMETDDPEGFIKVAELNPKHYGAHGLKTFLAAHHQNAIHPTRDVPWSERGWGAYDQAVTELGKS